MKVEPSPELKQAIEEAADSIVTLDELRADSSEEKMRKYAEGLIARMEEEDPVAAEILKPIPGQQLVDRKKVLVDNLMRTLPVRLAGVREGHTTPEDFERGVLRVISRQISGFETKKAA